MEATNSRLRSTPSNVFIDLEDSICVEMFAHIEIESEEEGQNEETEFDGQPA